MGAITHEKNSRYIAAADYANRMATINQEQRMNDTLLKWSNKGSMPAAITKGAARMFTNTAQAGSMKSIMGDTIGAGATLATLPGYGDRAKQEIDDAKAQKAYVNQTADSNFGGALASNTAKTFQNVGKAAGGLYGASYVAPAVAAGAKAAGYGGIANSMTALGGVARTAGMETMKANPFSPTSWMSKASDASSAMSGGGAGSTMKMNALAPWALGKAGAGMSSIGGGVSSLGATTVGGGISSAGGGLSTLATTLATADPVFGTTASILAMMGGSIVANKFLNKMRALHPMKKGQSGKNITMTIRAGSKLAVDYAETLGIDSSVSAMSAQDAFTPFERANLFYSSIIAKNSGLLQYLAEKFQELLEKSRVGGNLAQNKVSGNFNTFRDDGLTAGYQDIGSDKTGLGKVGFQLNKGLAALNTGMSAVSAIASPMNYLSIKNNPVALLNDLFASRTENKAFENVARSNGTPINFERSLETPAAKAMGETGSIEEKMLLLTAGLYENVRYIGHLIKSKFSGKDSIGMVAKEKDRLDAEEAGGMINNFFKGVEDVVSYIPLLGSLTGTAMKLGRGTINMGKGIDKFIGNEMDTISESRKDYSIIDAMSPTELMARYIGKEFPDRFEKLLDKAHDRNNILKEIAREWGVNEERLKDTTSGAKWVQEFGKMMNAQEAGSSFMDAAEISAENRTEELAGQSFLARIFKKKALGMGVQDASKRDASKKMSSLFSGGDSRSADASQQRVIDTRLNKESTSRSIKLTDSVTNIESLVEKISKQSFGGSTKDDKDGKGFWSGLFTGGAIGAMAWLKKIFTGGLGKVKAWSKLGVLKGKSLMRGALNFLGPLGKVFKPAMVLAGAVELYLEWDNVVDTVKEKFNDAKNFKFKQLFGMENQDGSFKKDAFQASKDISKTMWIAAAGLATFFPNPVTYALAAGIGLYAYQDEIFDVAKSAGNKFLNYFKDPERQDKINENEDAKSKDNKLARAIEKANGNAGRSVLAKTTRETFSTKDFEALLLKNNIKDVGYDLHELGNKDTEIKWIQILNDMQVKFGKDSDDRMINSKEELQKVVEELSKSQEFQKLDSNNERRMLIDSLNALADKINSGNSTAQQQLRETEKINFNSANNKMEVRTIPIQVES